MNYEQFKLELTKYGNPVVISKGYVFNLLLIGDAVAEWKTMQKIQGLIMQHAGEQYPMLEVFYNTENYLLCVMKPRQENTNG
jgi:hypothetical protein